MALSPPVAVESEAMDFYTTPEFLLKFRHSAHFLLDRKLPIEQWAINSSHNNHMSVINTVVVVCDCEIISSMQIFPLGEQGCPVRRFQA